MVAESSNPNISITLRVWRQAGPGKPGKFVDYQVKDINVNMSFLEMLDVLNEQLTLQDQEPIAFAHDCREGICGTCETKVISGIPDHRDSVLSAKEKATNKSMMVCVSGCKSSALVLDL